MISDYYFENIVHNLTFEEVGILGILSDRDATAAFKAIKRSELLVDSQMTVANFRKVFGKLTATRLVDVVTGNKEHKVFLTNFGQVALDKSLEEVEEE